MSINFSDLQVILQRSQEIERLHQVQQHQSRVQQQQFAQKLEEEVRHKEDQVQKEETAQNVKLNERQQRRLGYRKGKHSKRQNEKEAPLMRDGDLQKNSGHIIDYRA